MAAFNAAKKAGQALLNLDIAAIEKSLPPDPGRIPVYLDRKLFDQRMTVERKSISAMQAAQASANTRKDSRAGMRPKPEGCPNEHPDHHGKKTAVINVFIDPERGFLDLSLTDARGGVLYVPKGEEVSALMGGIITKSRDTVFVLGQDYHPANHISFMVNHPGLMEYRIEKFRDFLAAHKQPAMTDDQIYLQAQQPVHFFNGFDKPPVPFAFNEIVLDEDRNIIGLKEDDGRIRKVKVETSSGLAPSEKDRGRVTAVLDDYFEKTFDDYRRRRPAAVDTDAVDEARRAGHGLKPLPRRHEPAQGPAGKTERGPDQPRGLSPRRRDGE